MNDPGQSIQIRHLGSLKDYEAAVELQYQTWGKGFAGCVPAAILMVAQKVGGISAGAFTPDGRMVGCVFGITGVRDGVPVHWSDILAVSPEVRGTGLGKRLKWFQRQELLRAGVRTMFWTFDPLQALNANLNLNTLRARPVEYVVNMYGDTGSDLHSGLGTDRFVVQWDLESVDVIQASHDTFVSTGAVPAGLIVNSRVEGGTPVPLDAPLPDADVVLIEVPQSINDTKRASFDAGVRWRESTRRAFQYYLARGMIVSGFRELEPGRFGYVMSFTKP